MKSDMAMGIRRILQQGASFAALPMVAMVGVGIWTNPETPALHLVVACAIVFVVACVIRAFKEAPPSLKEFQELQEKLQFLNDTVDVTVEKSVEQIGKEREKEREARRHERVERLVKMLNKRSLALATGVSGSVESVSGAAFTAQYTGSDAEVKAAVKKLQTALEKSMDGMLTVLACDAAAILAYMRGEEVSFDISAALIVRGPTERSRMNLRVVARSRPADYQTRNYRLPDEPARGKSKRRREADASSQMPGLPLTTMFFQGSITDDHRILPDVEGWAKDSAPEFFDHLRHNRKMAKRYGSLAMMKVPVPSQQLRLGWDPSPWAGEDADGLIAIVCLDCERKNRWASDDEKKVLLALALPFVVAMQGCLAGYGGLGAQAEHAGGVALTSKARHIGSGESEYGVEHGQKVGQTTPANHLGGEFARVAEETLANHSGGSGPALGESNVLAVDPVDEGQHDESEESVG